MLVELVEQQVKAVHEVLDGRRWPKGHGKRDEPPEGAHVAPSVCEFGGGRLGGHDLQSRELPNKMT